MAMRTDFAKPTTQKTSDSKAWKPGMTYVSPVTGKATTDPADVPGTKEWQARQAAVNAGRYTGGYTPVVTYDTGSAGRSTAGGSYGSSGKSAASSAAAAAAAAQAAATRAANNAASSGANQRKTALQQAIDAALAQKATNQSKLNALSTLTSSGLAAGRETSLGGIKGDLDLLLKQALENYDLGVGDLNTNLRDNDKAESDSTFGNFANRAREKQDLVGAALAQGAGESDILKAGLQALRNWSSNQGEINRSYFDTLSSTNAAITDLNTGTKSTMTGYEMDANQRRGQVWGDFYSGMADAYTQMDNLATNQYLLDQEIAANSQTAQGEDALLSWLKAGKSADSFVTPATAGSTVPKTGFVGYADKAADFAGQAWQNPGVSDATKAWEGQAATTAQLSTAQDWNAQTNTGTKKKPEGASLRRW